MTQTAKLLPAMYRKCPLHAQFCMFSTMESVNLAIHIGKRIFCSTSRQLRSQSLLKTYWHQRGQTFPVCGNCRCHYLQVQVFTVLITMESVNLTMHIGRRIFCCTFRELWSQSLLKTYCHQKGQIFPCEIADVIICRCRFLLR